MSNKCDNSCNNGLPGSGRAVYHCTYSNAGQEGPHGEHDWFSYLYGEWMHCYGSDE